MSAALLDLTSLTLACGPVEVDLKPETTVMRCMCPRAVAGTIVGRPANWQHLLDALQAWHVTVDRRAA